LELADGFIESFEIKNRLKKKEKTENLRKNGQNICGIFLPEG